MSQKRDKIIGIRLTQEEKEEIEVYIKDQGLSITEFIRRAISSYNNNIEEDAKKQHLRNVNYFSEKLKKSLLKVNKDFKSLNLALNEFSSNFNQLNKELYLYMFKRTN